MDSNLSATGQKGLAFLATNIPGTCKHRRSDAIKVPGLGKVRSGLPKSAIGVGVTAAAVQFAEGYGKGDPAEENVKEAAVEAVQVFSAMNASRMLARWLAGWKVTKPWSKCTVRGASLLVVLAADDLRTYVVKQNAPQVVEQVRSDQQKELRHSLASSGVLFALMMWPTGEAIVRAFVGWYMLRTACAATARLLFGDKGYSKFSALLTEVEGSINGFLVIVSFPLICAWTALAGLGNTVGRGAGTVASGVRRKVLAAWSGLAGVFSRQDQAEG